MIRWIKTDQARKASDLVPFAASGALGVDVALRARVRQILSSVDDHISNVFKPSKISFCDDR